MEITAQHTFARPLDQVWAMFLDPEAHVGKYADMGQRDVEIVEMQQRADALDITIVRIIDGEVPAIAKKFIKPSNAMTTKDQWERDTDGTCTGRSVISVRNVPIASSAVATLVADGADACTYTIDLTVHLKIPVVGDRILRALRPQLLGQMEAEFDASERWLARTSAP